MPGSGWPILPASLLTLNFCLSWWDMTRARASGDMSLLQVTAKNDTTLEVVLNGNYDWFLSQVCTSPATMPLRQDVIQSLKEDAMAARDSGEDEDASWWSDPTKLVTNGAFTATSATADQMVLSSNADYYGTRSGPDELVFRYADTPEEASALYEAEEVSAVWTLTEEQLTQAAENPEWTRYSGAVHLYGAVQLQPSAGRPDPQRSVSDHRPHRPWPQVARCHRLTCGRSGSSRGSGR